MGLPIFPRPDGNFHLQESGVLSFAALVVEGSTVPTRSNLPARTASYGNALSSTPSGPANAATNSSAASLSFTSSPPLFRLVVAPRRTSPSFNLKVVKAEIIRKGRKIEFKGKQQTFIEIVDSTANVEHISGVVRRRWGSDYVIVTQDGLELEDAPATQGTHYYIIIYGHSNPALQGYHFGNAQKERFMLSSKPAMKRQLIQRKKVIKNENLMSVYTNLWIVLKQ